MNGLGVGGSQSPNLVNAANALLYAFMTVTCFAGPWMTNLIGFRWTLAIGSLGYPLYAAGLYTNNRFGVTWFVYVGAVACGISAGFFWSVEGMLKVAFLSAVLSSFSNLLKMALDLRTAFISRSRLVES